VAERRVRAGRARVDGDLLASRVFWLTIGSHLATLNSETATLNDKLEETLFNRAVRLLAAKPRSVAEIRDRLLKPTGIDPNIVEAVLKRLAEYGYVNDERFAFSYASYRLRQKPIGRRRLQLDLSLKKVDRETAEEALKIAYAETPEDEIIDRAIEKRTRLRGHPGSPVEMNALFNFLLRQGFPYELVSEKVQALRAKV
jgi:regulatory protein